MMQKQQQILLQKRLYWRVGDGKTGLWRIPLQANVTDLNTDNLLLDSQDESQSLNSSIILPTTESVLDHLQILLDERPDTKEAIHNVYDLTSIEPAIQYLHAATGFLAKATWIKAICNNNYLTWPLVCVKTWTTISLNPKKPNLDTWRANNNECGPPRRFPARRRNHKKKKMRDNR